MTESDFAKNLQQYTQTLDIAVRVSIFASGRQVNDKRTWACVLFTKLCVTGRSILILSPNNTIATAKIPHWDFSSLFSLTRNLIECYHVFFYLCIDDIPYDEYKARKQLLNLHDFHSRKTLLSTENSGNNAIEQSIIDELTSTEYFKNLDQKQQKHFLRGANSFFISREEIEARAGNDKNNFKILYKLFSSNTHSYPLGFYRMLDASRGTGVKSDTEVGYSALALEIAEGYMRDATNNMIILFPDINKKLTVVERNHLIK